jgi:hypothetical protein
MDYQYLIFAHLLGLVIFVAAHGVSMFLTAALRRERDPGRLRAMLDLSLLSLPANYVGLLLLIASGVWLGFAGGYWSQGWIWTALVLLVALLALMMAMGVTFFSKVRAAVGLQPYRQTRQVTLGPIAAPEELERLLSGPQLRLTMIVGLVGLVLILGLMILKPF